jgi:hypothetical protein
VSFSRRGWTVALEAPRLRRLTFAAYDLGVAEGCDLAKRHRRYCRGGWGTLRVILIGGDAELQGLSDQGLDGLRENFGVVIDVGGGGRG